jgi:FkbM family methyltransferase
MGKYSDSFLNRVINLTNGRLYSLLRNFHFWIKGYPIKLRYSVKYYTINQNDEVLYLASKKRYGRYGRGINNLVNKLAHTYFLDEIEFKAGDTFIDCGANIGELGLWFERNRPFVNYIGFEPSKNEFEALKLNLKNSQTLVNKALWDKNETIKFYSSVDTADSSTIQNGLEDDIVNVEAIRLDDFANNLNSIKVLKIEAEGAEPEVLMGAIQCLKKCEYVVVDSGPERGIEQRETTVEVKNILESNQFQFEKKSSLRTVYLYRNTRSL